MAILQEDIKLLKSAVMADTSDGGGAMTGIVVIDGQSNNLFPDTSAMDRAIGRVQQRLVYGVAHVDNTDTLMGAHAIITDAPADPLVHCVLMEAGAWAEEHDASTARIERYLVKGPKLGPALYDTHYAGSLQIRLISFVNATFPAGGDGIVLRNPSGDEQYVRVLKIATSSQQIAVEEGGNVVVLTATIGLCDLGQELDYDFFGPPAARVFAAASFCQVFGTAPATGAKFYGLKPLAAVGAPGDLSVLMGGGIYTPLVPAATVESAIIDQYPLQGRSTLVGTGYAALTLPSFTMTIGPGAIIRTPTAIKPKSVVLTGGVTPFTDSGAGVLLQGGNAVGTVDYAGRSITFSTSAPVYGSGGSLTYTPATAAGSTANSASLMVTQANQGLAYTTVFTPRPAPGSFTLSYMAQGRWYDLTDDLNGKLAGADGSYGVGTLSYTTGSMAVTLGAIPDVGSVLIATWGDPSGATSVATTSLPSQLEALLPLPAGTLAAGIAVTWSRGGTNYSATTNSNGVLVGNATGRAQYNGLLFQPSVLPDGTVSVSSTPSASFVTTLNSLGSGAYQIVGTLPVHPGTFKGLLRATYPEPAVGAGMHTTDLWDLNGVLYANLFNTNGAATLAVGTINYATGAVTVPTALLVTTWTTVRSTSTDAWNIGQYLYTSVAADISVAMFAQPDVTYAHDTPAPSVQAAQVASWALSVNAASLAFLTSGTAFTLGGEVYTADAGVLRKGWNAATGQAAVASAGAVASTGSIALTELPANGVNTLVWYNAAVNASPGRVTAGVFRTASAPLKTGVFQLHAGALVGTANDGGVISGGFEGAVDYARGVVRWTRAGGSLFANAINPAELAYNAVFLQYLPLEKGLLGLDTARIPLDGKVPIFRKGDKVLVHNTQTFTLPNPLTKGVTYDWGRERTASVRVKDLLGATVPSTLYTTNLDAGTITVPPASVITAYSQPFTVEHRIEDLVVCSVADISGKLTFTRSLTHDFPLGSSFASSALVFGDLFARAYNVFEQQTWSSTWSDARTGSTILAQFNAALYPLVVTNRGAITERWALIFTSSTAFRVIGESVGEIATGNTSTDCAPGNPATLVPYFTLPALGWGNGWAAGNVLRFNTDACGTGFWAVRTVLQGPATVASDKFALAFRGDVDRP